MPVKVTLKINMDKLNSEEQSRYKQLLVTGKGFTCNTLNEINSGINMGEHNFEKIENELDFPKKNSSTSNLDEYIRRLDRNFSTCMNFSRSSRSWLSTTIYSIDIVIGKAIFEKL